MVSTYDRRQGGYYSEGRLSRIKSGSTGTLYHQQSRMSTYNTNYGGAFSRLQASRDEDYIYAWCHHYGLTPATARVLSINRIESSEDLLRLDRHTINQLDIRDNEKLLFRGALLQFKQSDYETARKQAAKGKFWIRFIRVNLANTNAKSQGTRSKHSAMLFHISRLLDIVRYYFRLHLVK